LSYSKHYARDIGILTGDTPWESFTISVSKLLNGYSYGYYLFGLAPFYFVFLKNFRFDIAHVSIIGTTFAGLFAVSLGGCFWNHYFMMGLLGLILPAFYGAYYLEKTPPTNGMLLKSATLCASLLLSGYLASSRISEALRSEPVNFSFSVPSSLSSASERYTSPGDHILIITSSPMYLVMLNRSHSSKWGVLLDEFLRFYPGKSEVERIESLRREILQNRPKLVFIEASFVLKRQERILSNIVMPLLQHFSYRQIAPGVFVSPELL
jgi:hypothetical protein